jgi:hypothetical protein
MGNLGLSHSSNKNSCGLLWKVRSWFGCDYFFLLELQPSCALQLTYICGEISVCSSWLPLTFSNWPFLRILTELIFRGIWDLQWCSSNYQSHTDIHARTTSHPWYTRISCQSRGQLRRDNCYDFNCFPGACIHFKWRWCIAQEILLVIQFSSAVRYVVFSFGLVGCVIYWVRASSGYVSGYVKALYASWFSVQDKFKKYIIQQPIIHQTIIVAIYFLGFSSII